MTKTQKHLWIGLLIMALITPVGILLPEIFNSGGAWGEWSTEALEKLLGYVPEGLKRYADIWKAPLPDYNQGGEGASAAQKLISYIISGITGALAAAGIIYIISKMLRRNEK